MHPERPVSWFIGFCLVLLLSSVAMATYPYNCSPTTCVVQTEKAFYTIDRYGARLQVLNHLGLVVPGSTTIGIGFSHLVERMKTVTDASMEASKCLVSDRPSSNVTNQGSTAGLRTNYLEIAPLSIAMNPSQDDPVTGVLTIRIPYFLDGRKVFEQVISISDRDTSLLLSNDTRFTNGTAFVADYRYVSGGKRMSAPCLHSSSPEWRCSTVTSDPLFMLLITYTDDLSTIVDHSCRKGGLKITASIPTMTWSASDSGAYYNSSFLTLYANVTGTRLLFMKSALRDVVDTH